MIPITCEFENKRKEYSNGSVFLQTAFDKPYRVNEITVENGKIVISLIEDKTYLENSPINWIGEEAVSQISVYDMNEHWVKDYIEQFGEEPSFF